MTKFDWEKANKRFFSAPFFDNSWETEVSDTDIKDIPLSEAKKPSKTAEPVKQEEHKKDMERHAKKRAAQKKYRLKKKAEEIKRKEKRLNANRSFEAGKEQQLERIIQIIEKRKAYDCRCSCDCHAYEAPCTTCQADNELIEIIKGEEK